MRSRGPHVLVAGVGNLFCSDDGFGPEVARRLARSALPEGVRVVDYGIRGVHLAFDLLDDWDALVLIDAIGSRGATGTLHVLRLDPAAGDGARWDAHGMDPAAVLAGVEALGGHLPPTCLVGCEAAGVGDGIGLTSEVNAALDRAAQTVVDLVVNLDSWIDPATVR